MNLRDKKYIAIDRAINEFRSGRPIIVNKDNDNWIFFTIEHVDNKLITKISKSSDSKIFACITANKAKKLYGSALKYNGSVKLNFKLSKIKWLRSAHNKEISDFKNNKIQVKELNKTPKFFNDIINLAKNAKMTPCLVGSYIKKDILDHSIMVFKHKDLIKQYELIAESTKIISKSQIPLDKAHKSYIRVFKSFIGGLEHVVLQIGNPRKKGIINLRIQSACLTGEVFHSIKCDCNEQLHQSIEYISKHGGGYIIHLEQEGRGIGLANKIKAYDMQYKGMDTYDADVTMGFKEDERDFNIAVKILKFLKIKKVNIITNNQLKIKTLKKYGIKINKRIPTYPTLNKYNYKYLSSRIKKTKYKIAVK